MVGIDVSQFITIFGGNVRAALDWSAIEQPAFTVAEVFTRSRDLLGGLTTVWYAMSDGTPAEWDSPCARPLRVARAAYLPTWGRERVERLGRMERRFWAEEEPIQLALPAVRAPSGEIVVIDGNHRACAAYRAQVDLRLLLFVVEGPTSTAILPDLRHFPAAAVQLAE